MTDWENNWVFVPFNGIDEKGLTLKDYDIHCTYVSRRVAESDKISDKQKVDAFMFMNTFRFWIIQGNFVSSNIRRVNHMVRRAILQEENPYNLVKYKGEIL